jgi:hypothetical protein
MISDAGSAGAEGNSAPVVITGEGEGKLSVADAARTLARARKPQQEQPEQRATEAPQPQGSEAPQAEDAAPPIEPPRSWTKEAKEQWQALPRNTQEYLAQREQERDREVRRSQNEAAEKLKGLRPKSIRWNKQGNSTRPNYRL